MKFLLTAITLLLSTSVFAAPQSAPKKKYSCQSFETIRHRGRSVSRYHVQFEILNTVVSYTVRDRLQKTETEYMGYIFPASTGDEGFSSTDQGADVEVKLQSGGGAIGTLTLDSDPAAPVRLICR